jgi:hypothetical protein
MIGKCLFSKYVRKLLKISQYVNYAPLEEIVAGWGIPENGIPKYTLIAV